MAIFQAAGGGDALDRDCCMHIAGARNSAPREVLGVAAAAQERLILQLDTGGHMAVIRGLAFTPDGKFIVSAGDDKVIRVWDWRTGKTVRTIRGQSGRGQEGKIYAMALSPDGRWLAAGGYLARLTVQSRAKRRKRTKSASTISPAAS